MTDYSFMDQVNTNLQKKRDERSKNEIQKVLKDADREAKIIIGILSTVMILIALMLETPH